MLHKKIFFTIVLIFVFSFSVSALGGGDLSAKSAVVINASTGEVVFEKNAHQRRSMASTTKIMTALLAVESGRENETVNITSSMCGAEGTSIGLKAGYKIKFLDLIYGMMLESGNDAANATAIFLSGSREAFAEKMNEKAASLGMTGTHFVTPSGLDDENHYTTAYDMALLGCYAVNIPLFREICSSKTKKADFISPDITVTFSNHNRMLRSYEGAIGIKTGFTKKSGRCLVCAAERDGAVFVSVTLSAGDDWNDHRKMLDYAFETVKKRDVYLRLPKSVSLAGGTQSEISVEASKYPVRVSYQSEGKITQRVYLPSFVYAPINKGDKLGEVKLFYNDKSIESVDIIASQSCKAQAETYIKDKSFFEKIKDFFSK